MIKMRFALSCLRDVLVDLLHHLVVKRDDAMLTFVMIKMLTIMTMIMVMRKMVMKMVCQYQGFQKFKSCNRTADEKDHDDPGDDYDTS